MSKKESASSRDFVCVRACMHACVCVCVCVCVSLNFQSKQRALTFSSQIWPKMDLWLDIQKTNVAMSQ